MKAGAIALASAVLVASVAAACTSIAHGSIDHQPEFTITNTISSSATLQTPALLYPGVPRYLWYTAHNPLNVPITVRYYEYFCPLRRRRAVRRSTSITPSTNFSGSLVVPANGSNSTPVPISLFETHTNQDSCEHKVFQFKFQGSATFSAVVSTQTLLSSSHNPSIVGQSVTYTATVISGGGSGNQPNAGVRRVQSPSSTARPRFARTFRSRLASTGPLRRRARLRPIWSLAFIRSRLTSRIPTEASRIRRPRCSIKSSNRRTSPPRF